MDTLPPDTGGGRPAADTPRPIERQPLAAAHRVVVKVGTRVLTREDGRPALARLFAIVEQLADLRRAGREVLLVSSGAVGLGRERLGIKTALTLEDRQACAAAGQSALMALYEQGLGRFGLVSAQLLLTRGDFESRTHYLNLRSTLNALLRRGVVPVINENDVVATEELAWDEGDGRGAPVTATFGDNDQLSALVAAKLEADLLVLLTDVDGVHASDPRGSPGGACLDELSEAEAAGLAAAFGDSASGVGRGGMRSKVAAARLATRAGCHVVIASGLPGDSLRRITAGERCGTWFRARPGLAGKRRWIAFATTARGRLHLDAGAVTAITERGASLLAAGVREVSGDFRRGDVVELCAPDGSVIGRGIVCCDVATARAWAAGARPAGVRNHDALVHRDQLAIAEGIGAAPPTGRS